ncbi:unnamed protein product [Cylicocyclus nassatus]|uniref:EndoU domain-containing protein n=1 Tax=Cylicocyclus nassatus TaxID=53992 RepID=A0AA36M2K8_CYLNA|nr:unnamed protein product [Cylicocyclus nassatus]
MFPFVVLAVAFVQCTARSLPNFLVEDEELLKMSKILRAKDVNKAGPGQILINYQLQVQSREGMDSAAKPFFTRVSSELLNKPSYKRFINMMNNFYKEIGIPEPRVSKKQEREEISLFLDTILATKPWKILYKFLQTKNHPFAEDRDTFRNSIKHLWFDHYSRARGELDTSGFEHVFIGEEDHGMVSGLHNWVRFYMLEKNPAENFDYKGYNEKKGYVMAGLTFMWGNAFKWNGSILIGTSPEYEMALYTMCFLSRREKDPCKIELDGIPLSINSYATVQNREVYISTIYPTIRKRTQRKNKNKPIRKTQRKNKNRLLGLRKKIAIISKINALRRQKELVD